MNGVEKEHNERILEQFTKQAEPFAAVAAHSAEETLRILTEALAVNASDRALDVACGPGIVSCALAARAKHVTGVDLVPAMLDQAAKLQHEKHLENIEWKLGNAARLEFADSSFSLVVTRYSFHHLLDPASALREMARVCRPGGRVAVADVTPAPNKLAAYDELELLRDESHTRALALDQLKAMGNGLGLALLREEFFRVDIGVEALLAASFPAPGKAEEFRRRVREDVGRDRLSIEAYLRNGEVRFSFPTSVVVWIKPASA